MLAIIIVKSIFFLVVLVSLTKNSEKTVKQKDTFHRDIRVMLDPDFKMRTAPGKDQIAKCGDPSGIRWSKQDPD